MLIGVGLLVAAGLAMPMVAAGDDAADVSGEISFSGDAATSSTSWSYHIEDLDAVEDLDIEIEGREATEPRSSSTTAETASWDIDIGGTTEPEDAVMRLEGLDSGETETRSGALSPGESDTITVEGDDPPTDSELTIEGEYSESGGSESGSVSGSSTESFDVDGSLDPEGESISFDADSPEFLYSSDSSHATSEELSEDSILNTRHTPSESFGVVEFGGSWAEYENPSGWGDVEIKDYTGVIETGTVEFGEDEEFRLIADSEIDVEEVDWEGNLRIKAIESTWESDASLSIANTDSTDVTYRYYEPMATEVTVDGETYGVDETRSLDLNTGSNSVDISPNAGAVSYSASWTERDGVVDPSVSVDGNTVSESGEFGGSTTESIDLSTGSHSIDASYDGEGLAYEIEWTERTYPENPSIDLAGETIAEAGTLEPGETVEEAVSLPLGESTVDVASDGPVEASVEWTEVSATEDPEVSINGETTSHSGTLAPGETTSLDASDEWVQEGDNSIDIDLAGAGGGPEPQVGVDVSHIAASTVSAAVTSTTWGEDVELEQEFASTQEDVEMSLPMPDNVVAMKSVEERRDGGEWSTVDSDRYELAAALDVDAGTVDAETVEVRATASKIQVPSGAVSVEDATPEGADLSTRIRVDDDGGDDPVEIDVSETVDGDRVHRLASADWSSAETHVATADGKETLRLPDAVEGTHADIETAPLAVSPSTGEVEVSIDNVSEPRFSIGPGATSGDELEVAYHAVESGQDYELYSLDEDRRLDAGTASSPVIFETDDRESTYVIRETELGGGPGITAGTGGSSSGGIAAALLVLVGVGSVGAVGFLSQRAGMGRRVTVLAAVVATVGIAEVSSSSSLVGTLSADLLRGSSDALIATAASVGGLVALWSIDRRTDRRIPNWLYGGLGVAGGGWLAVAALGQQASTVVGLLVGSGMLVALWRVDKRFGLPRWLLVVVGMSVTIWMLSSIAPGLMTEVIIEPLADGMTEIAPLFAVGLLVVVLAWLRRRGDGDEVVLEVSDD